LSRVGLR